ncbi:LPXTG cell wall anchor domain-containing protein [Umezawaea sp.]|uniref:LPXTG cell wall anchor domain-containing protein n=1 Tax=Umezawaea sp. TaxID=1955258 RepID=UPI002ED1766F
MVTDSSSSSTSTTPTHVTSTTHQGGRWHGGSGDRVAAGPDRLAHTGAPGGWLALVGLLLLLGGSTLMLMFRTRKNA